MGRETKVYMYNGRKKYEEKSEQDNSAVGTEKAWELCEKYRLPRMFFVTEMDMDDVSYRQVVEDLTELYGKRFSFEDAR